MRILTVKAKGQSIIEYALMIALMIIVVLILPYLISGVGQSINAVGNSLGLQTPPTPTTVPPPSTSKRNFIIFITVVTSMGIPAFVSFITSTWDGAIGNEPPGQVVAGRTQVRRDNQGRCKNCGTIEGYGRFSAKLCLSAISFEIWGLTNAFQGKVDLRTDLGVENQHLAILLVALILLDISFHFVCSKWISNKNMPFRLILVLFSVLFPTFVFYGLTI
jgi:hypothetical protein